MGELAASTSARNASALEMESDGTSVNCIGMGEGLDRFPGLVALDEFCDFVHT
jgi:hypothetical protein